jgi:hypothetical protein
VDFLTKALQEKKPEQKKIKVTLYWDEATWIAVSEFCVHHRGWNKSTLAEAAVLEKLEKEKEQPKKPVEMIMRHTGKTT